MPAPAKAAASMDPSQIQSPAQIPPPGSQFEGQSPQGIVDVYAGNLPGDIDAQPAAKELLGTALDTGSLSNADYIYKQVSALYAGVDLPNFQSPSGNNVKSVVFVSGSNQGGYGAFHIEGATQADFDRIVVDSLNGSGNYSAGSGLGSAMAPLPTKKTHRFPMYRGASDLLGVFHADDERLKTAKEADIREALAVGTLSTVALKTAIETRNAARVPGKASSHRPQELAKHTHAELARKLMQVNQDLAGLVRAAAQISGSRQYLSTALFAAEIVESFQLLTGKADAGRTDGEAVSRVLAFKLAPEIALIPGFNGGVTQQWWKDGHPDFANDNSQNDQSTDGNAAGVMFLLFLTDYLSVALDAILKRMPAAGAGGAPLGNTYVALLKDFPNLAQVAGKDGPSAFQTMVSLLQQNTQNPDGSLNLPADGNPFPSMLGAKQGGLFAAGPTTTTTSGSLGPDTQSALGLEAQLEQQLASLKAALQQIQSDVSASPAPASLKAGASQGSRDAASVAAFGYKPPLVSSLVASLDQRVAADRAPQYDQTLKDEFWKHVYNELPGSGPNTNRLQVITGTTQAPLAVQVKGTIQSTKLEPDGDLHIAFQPDDPSFPTNQAAGESPLELEIIYAGPVTQADAKQAQAGFKNPFDISQLGPGTRIQAAGPLIFDRAHGKPSADGKNVDIGLEIHPVAGITVLSGETGGTPPVTQPANPVASSTGQLSADLASAVGQAGTLTQTVGNLTALLQKMQGEAPTN